MATPDHRPLYEPAMVAVCSFFPPPNESQTWAIVPPSDIFDTILLLHMKIPQICPKNNNNHINTPNTKDKAAATLAANMSNNTNANANNNSTKGSPNTSEISDTERLWLYSIGSLCTLCGHPRRSIKELALRSLRHALLAAGWAGESPTAWRECFQKGLIPMLNSLCGKQALDEKSAKPNATPPKRGARGVAGGRNRQLNQHNQLNLDAVTLIFQCFLHHLEHLGSMEGFSVFWFKFLGSIEKYMRTNNQDKELNLSEQFVVHITENFKNLFLVMCTSGIFKTASQNAGQDLLALSLSIVGSFRPDLKSELMGLTASGGVEATNSKPASAK